MTDLICMDCGGPLFENFVRRFDEPIRAVGRISDETPARTKYKDGHQCRKCGTFFPFRVRSERDSSCRGVPSDCWGSGRKVPSGEPDSVEL